MNLSFKNRIALYYMLATAGITVIVFYVIYIVVQAAVYQELDNDLSFEARKHREEIFLKSDSILFINKNEWAEREHLEVQVNPVFIQIVNKEGSLMDKSPNLKEGNLVFYDNKQFYTQFDTKLNSQTIRQIQMPIEQKGVLKGYILAAMSLEGAIIVLKTLKSTLLLLFPLVLLGLFLITRFLAGRSIIPIQTITRTANRITRKSLNERIPLPENKDELFVLTSSINELLDRMQEAMEREKQFTADASHQLRTPLAVLKGTLEVLVRKPREEAEYREKIIYSIKEIDRISEVVNQLLLLARLDKLSAKVSMTTVDLQIVMDDILQRFRSAIMDKKLSVNVASEDQSSILSDPYYVDLILENILSNAVKYAHSGTVLGIRIYPKKDKMVCEVHDDGIVINASDLDHIFHPFYRSEALNHKEIKGNGLGLSIVKKVGDLLNVEISVSSELTQGTTFSLAFPLPTPTVNTVF